MLATGRWQESGNEIVLDHRNPTIAGAYRCRIFSFFYVFK